MPITCIYNLFNSRGVPFHVAEEACKVCFSIKPLIDPYLRETVIFEHFLIQLAQAWSNNTIRFYSLNKRDKVIDRY